MNGGQLPTNQLHDLVGMFVCVRERERRREVNRQSVYKMVLTFIIEQMLN